MRKILLTLILAVVALSGAMASAWYLTVAIVFSMSAPRQTYQRFARAAARILGAGMVMFAARLAASD